MFHNLLKKRGQSLVEYMLIVAFIGLGTATAITTLGDNTSDTFDPANESMATAVTKSEQDFLDMENRKNINDYSNGGLQPRQDGGGSGGSTGSSTGGSTGSTAPPPNRPPVADFVWRPEAPLPRQTVQVLNISTDPDADRIAKAEWILNGASVSMLPSTFPAGANEVKLRVMDERGAWSSWKTKTLTVQNQPPQDATLTYTPSDNIKVNTVVTFTANSKDPNEDSVSYEWYYKGTKLSNKTSVLKHTFPERGDQVIEVIPVDEWGLKGPKKSVTVKVSNSAPTVPTLSCTPATGIYNNTVVTCTASGSTDIEKDTISYEYRNKTSNGLYPVGDTYVQARAVDNLGGASDWATATVKVTNRLPSKPQVTARVVSKTSYYTTITFEAYGSVDPDGGNVTYEWSGKSDDNRYYNGSHTIKVRAKDQNGGYSEWYEYTFDAQSPMKTIFESWENYVINSASGQWRYDATNDYIYSTQNVGWTGFYNPDDVNLANYRLTWQQAVLNDGDDDTMGMTFRMKDAKNFYFIAFDNGSVNGGDIKGGLYKMTNGSYTRLLAIPHTWRKNTWDSMQIDAVGNQITVKVNGTTYTYTDNSNPYLNGSFGPFTRSQAMGYFRTVTLDILN